MTALVILAMPAFSAAYRETFLEFRGELPWEDLIGSLIVSQVNGRLSHSGLQCRSALVAPICEWSDSLALLC
jgi:hypothetical protein